MAKKPPRPVYEFGELEKTRKNLGTVSQEEARRIAALLGGEVGTEKESPDISRGYDRIQRDSRRRTDLPPGLPEAGRGDSRGAASGSGSSGPGDMPEKPRRSALVIRPTERRTAGSRRKSNYWVRVRMNFLAARRDHNLITLGSALLSLVPAGSRKEDLNPEFLREGFTWLYEPILNLQKSARKLTEGTALRGAAFQPDPFYREIMEILAGWDVKTVYWEMTRLCNAQGNQSIDRGERLCRALFSPVIRLQNLEMKEHLSNAVRHYYELNKRIGKGEPGGEEARKEGLRKETLALLDLIPRVFHRIHYGCYPLLMKLCSSSFSSYDSYYRDREEDYLGFLNLGSGDLLSPPREVPPVIPEENLANPVEWKAPEAESRKIPPDFLNGLTLLQEMFPQAGFEDLSQFPDMYPYFVPLVSFPRNFELLPPEDPVHGITVIMLILKELFFGFGSVQFGSLKTEEWNLPDIRTTLEEYTGQWFRYLEDYLPRLILAPLLEYCRGVEKGEDFPESEYGEKTEFEITWYKRSLYLPHLKLAGGTRARPPLPQGVRKLSHLTDDLTSLLKTVLTLSAENPAGGGVNNMTSPVQFPVESPVSARFLQVLKNRNHPPVNGELIRSTAWILCILNELISNPDSFYYQERSRLLYRASGIDNRRPVYSLAPLKTMQIIREWDKRTAAGEVESVSLGEAPGHTEEDLLRDLETSLNNARNASVDSVLVHLELNAQVSGDPMEAVLENTIRNEGDHWYRIRPGECVLILENTCAQGAVTLAHRLQKQLVPFYEPTVNIYTAITPLSAAWNAEEALFRGKNTLREAEKKGTSVIVLFDGARKKYRIFAAARRPAEGAPHESVPRSG